LNVARYVVGAVFDYIIVNVSTFGAAFRSILNINVRHIHVLAV